MRRHRVLSGVVTTMVVCMLGVAGCDSSDPEPKDTTATSSPTADASQTSAAAELPDGYEYVTAPVSGFEIAIPDDWSAVDAESILSDPAMQSLLEDMAARQGVTTDQIMASGVDMVAMSAAGIPNVNVIEPQAGTLGSGFASQITAQLKTAFDATDVTTREVTTEVGDALVASYTATIQGTVFYQNQIYQQVGSSISVVTVTGQDADQAAELTGIILDTMRPVD